MQTPADGAGIGVEGEDKSMELLKKSLLVERIHLSRRRKAILVAITILALGFFFLIPFIQASEIGVIQQPCYFAGSCEPAYVHFTISLSCFLTGDNGQLGFLGLSYAPHVSTNGDHWFGCGGPVLT